jgi:hypothetical protein
MWDLEVGGLVRAVDEGAGFICDGVRMGSWMRVEGVRVGAGFGFVGGVVEELSFRFSSMLCGTEGAAVVSRTVGRTGSSSRSFFLKKDIVGGFALDGG